jgi:hypothetical protein
MKRYSTNLKCCDILLNVRYFDPASHFPDHLRTLPPIKTHIRAVSSPYAASRTQP